MRFAVQVERGEVCGGAGEKRRRLGPPGKDVGAFEEEVSSQNGLGRVEAGEKAEHGRVSSVRLLVESSS